MPFCRSRLASRPVARRFQRLSRAFIAGAAVLVGGAGMLAAMPAAASAPEPDPVSRRWQLDLRLGELRMMTVPMEGGAMPYLYLTYTVTNNSGEDLLLAPSFELATGEGEVLRSGRDVPLEATRAIIESLQNPLVEDQISIIGQMLQGRENAKDGVVIWPVTDMDTPELTVYAAGFSGETATVTPPGTENAFVLRKTLMTRLAVPGTLVGQGSTPLRVTEQRWIMR